jgi:cation diffusion facilitator family transporter
MDEVHTSRDRGTDRETALIRRVALYAFLLNLAIGGMKGVLAYFSSSLAVTAGAIDSGTDALTSLFLLGGLQLSTRKSRSFPLGLYKIENVLSVLVAISILFAGYEIAREIFRTSTSPPDISAGVVALLLLGVVATFAFGRYALRIGRTTDSPTLTAEGRHRQVDVLSSLVVLAAVLPAYFKWELSVLGVSVDQVAAGVVLIFIAWAGWELLADGMRVLLDASMDFETLDHVRRILETHPMLVRVNSLVGRNAGRFRFMQTSIVLRTEDLQRAHQISEELETAIRKEIPHVERVLIHYEPQPRTHLRVAVPLADPAGLISSHFGDSPYFALITVRLSDRGVEKEEIVENPHKDVQEAKGIRVAEWLVQHKVDRVFIREDLSRKGPGYVFGNAGITTVLTSAREVRKIMDSL